MTEATTEQTEGLLEPVPDVLADPAPRPLDYSQFPGRSNPPVTS